MSWLDYIAPPQGDYQSYIERKYGVGRAPAPTPEPEPTPPPPVKPGRVPTSPQIYGLAGKTMGLGVPGQGRYDPPPNPLFQVVGTTGGTPGYDNRASVAAYYQDLKN